MSAEHYSQHIDEWCNDSSFINKKTVDELCIILDHCQFTSKQFKQLFTIIKASCSIDESLSLMKHSKILNHNDPNESKLILEYVSKFFDIPLIYEVCNDIIYTYKFQNRIKNAPTATNTDSSNRNPQKVATSDENTAALRSIPKNAAHFLNIYEILQKTSNENDEYTIKVAVDEKYTEVKSGGIGAYPLLYAALSQENNLVFTLVKYGADPTVKTDYLDSLLHIFVTKNNLEGLKFAIKYVDVNSQDVEGSTPLHIAYRYGFVHIADFLLEQPGLNPNIMNQKGETPINIYQRTKQALKNN
ncbi:hypothetical protein TVAG_094350 [Trichomonas vaginalis G3]|uniref:Uncharacterized protein n=1 Tax=Trichomonas vaginalis (strain ATCC PRA-98 / G3) TaxID=412133 RepID=A2DBQ7_TRIV3|nr:RelA-associated inhibitor family [Trichomonas vaginalis G3]EAY22260.1 hypothetical protein TVAG_094350 [Trichomonas vaginalis G3]KAI5533269.1 RelA-associated inhibitor family [Trichomonas vaginalis G3]|eukprot:XP_001583246.1 hypothetical protein [Trichomonas vaginalis G3]